MDFNFLFWGKYSNLWSPIIYSYFKSLGNIFIEGKSFILKNIVERRTQLGQINRPRFQTHGLEVEPVLNLLIRINFNLLNSPI